ncbi:MAG: MarR family winged helix-turn-helix transcriptional regulator, partial [Rhodospirillaceae bacterium]
ARLVTRHFEQALRPVGLTAGQFNLLSIIGAMEPTTLPAIADAMAMDRTTLNRNIKPLIKSQIIECWGGAGRRPTSAKLTTKGHLVLAESSGLWRQAQTDLTALLGAAKAGQLIDILPTIRP